MNLVLLIQKFETFMMNLVLLIQKGPTKGFHLVSPNGEHFFVDQGDAPEPRLGLNGD